MIRKNVYFLYMKCFTLIFLSHFSKAFYNRINLNRVKLVPISIKLTPLYSAIDPAGSRGLTPSDRPLSWQGNKALSGGDLIDYNWKYGCCQSKVSFEGAQTIKRFRFCGDLMSVALTSGKLCIIRLSTGEILDKYNDHSTEITAIDYDGIHLATGAYDGSLNFYSLSYNNSKTFGTALHKFPSLHNRCISGLKFMPGKDSGSVYVATCGLDRKLVCTDYNR